MNTCSHCGGTLPADASFCPSCGRRADAPPDGRDVPIDVVYAKPRYFGIGPPVLILSVAAGLLVLGVVLLVLDLVVLGVIAIVLALFLLPAFLAGARRWPDGRVARLGLSTAGRARDEAGVAVESLSTWSRAGRDVVRLRKEQFGLRRRRDSLIRELGVSAFHEDGRADAIKASAKELDATIQQNDRELERTLAHARRRVRKGRAAVASTEVIRPEPESDAFEESAADEPIGKGRAAEPAHDEADSVEVDQRP